MILDTCSRWLDASRADYESCSSPVTSVLRARTQRIRAKRTRITFLEWPTARLRMREVSHDIAASASDAIRTDFAIRKG